MFAKYQKFFISGRTNHAKPMFVSSRLVHLSRSQGAEDHCNDRLTRDDKLRARGVSGTASPQPTLDPPCLQDSVAGC